jgi:hypothetical protein
MSFKLGAAVARLAPTLSQNIVKGGHQFFVKEEKQIPRPLRGFVKTTQ